MPDALDAMAAARTRVATASSAAEVRRVAVEAAEDLLDCEACELLCRADGGFDLAVRAGDDGPPADADRAAAERAFRSGEPRRIDDTTAAGDGDGRYRSLLLVPLGRHGVFRFACRDRDAFDDRSVALAVVFAGYVAHELDERRRADAGVLSAASLEHVLEVAETMILELDREGTVAFANERAREILGYEAGALVGRDWFETCVPERIRAETRDVFERLMEGEVDDAGRHENPVVTADGETRIIEWHNIVVPGTDGRPAGTLRSGLDVTERKERERELAATRERYRTLLQASPDPVFVADAETGEIVEVNEAAVDFRGQPREEIVGLHQSDLHPDDGGAYRDLFERHAESGGTKRRLPDGSPIYATTADGRHVPVEISVRTIELDDRTVVFGNFRDISGQLAHERALGTVNETTRDLFAARTPAEIARRIATAVTTVLDPAGVAFYLLDAETGDLRPAAHAPEEAADRIGEPPVFEPGESVAWRVFADGETAVFDDVRSAENVHDPETRVRSEILVPVGDYGVVVVGDTRQGVFDDRAVDLVEVLGSAAEVALDRVERERDLEARTEQLQRRTRQLERAESVNAQIRNVARVIVQSTTRREVEQAVCAELTESDAVALCWIGTIDPVDERLEPRAWAGNERGYLDRIALSLGDDETTEPSVRAARTEAPVVVENTAVDLARDPWRSQAVRRDLRSVMSVPLVYQGSLQGVLSVYATTPDAFGEAMRSALTGLGDLTAHAVAAIERKQALLSNHAIELDFEIRDRNCLFLRFTRESGCTLELEGIVPQSDDSSLVFVHVRDGSTATFLEAAEAASAVESARRIDSDDSLVQLRFVEPFLASILADQGISVHSITADDDACRVGVTVPPTFDLRRTVDVVSTAYPDSELVAKRERTPSSDQLQLQGELLERLTPRQREVLEVAYHRGYFESPKGASGEDLAAEFDFSPSAFHQHIRAAERSLFGALFENGSGFSR